MATFLVGRRGFALACALGAWLLAVAREAHAHFALISPPNWAQQNSLGDPQKSAPCGQADPGAVANPTNLVTTVDEGSVLTVTIDEKIYHSGHYRVVIAADQQSLPADPAVTAGTTPCGSTVIDATPSLPLLADGMLLHDAPFSGQQSFQVQLPPGFTCTNCVLQVAQFMTDHNLNVPGGCFYHHCANLTVQAVAPPDAGPVDAGPVDAGPVDAGMPVDSGTVDAGTKVDAGTPDGGFGSGDSGQQPLLDGGRGLDPIVSGCGCNVAPSALAAIVLLAVSTGCRRGRRNGR